MFVESKPKRLCRELTLGRILIFSLAPVFCVLVVFFAGLAVVRGDRTPKPVKPSRKDFKIYAETLRTMQEVDALLAKIEYETTDLVAKGYASSARGKTSGVLIRAIENH